MNRRDLPRAPSRCWVVLSLTAVLCCASWQTTLGQSLWELTPYRVHLQVTVDPVLNAGGRFQQRLARRLVDRCDAVIGATWNVELLKSDDAARRRVANWLDVPAHVPLTESIPEGADEQFDKLFIIQLNKDPFGYRIACREFDARTRTWSSTINTVARQPTRLVETTFEAMLSTFAPLAKIEEAEKKTATLRLRGAALPRPDGSWSLLQPGDLLRPLMRFNQRDGAPRKILPIEWTYLVVESIDASIAQCHIHSGLRNPLSARTRGRIERLALLVRPPSGATNLQLVTRGDRGSPLEGYEVFAHPLDSKKTTSLGQSDASGYVTVPASDRPLRILLVKHGGDFLARLPLVPGLSATVVAEIPNDDERLQVVGIITGMQENLVDLVVRREMLMLQLRAAIETQDFERADHVVSRLHGVRLDEDQFRIHLRQRKQAIVSSNPSVQRRIDKMFGDTSKLMASYFDPRPVLELEAELSQARQATAPAAGKQTPVESQEVPAEPAATTETPSDKPAAAENTAAQTS